MPKKWRLRAQFDDLGADNAAIASPACRSAQSPDHGRPRWFSTAHPVQPVGIAEAEASSMITGTVSSFGDQRRAGEPGQDPELFLWPRPTASRRAPHPSNVRVWIVNPVSRSTSKLSPNTSGQGVPTGAIRRDIALPGGCLGAGSWCRATGRRWRGLDPGVPARARSLRPAPRPTGPAGPFAADDAQLRRPAA